MITIKNIETSLIKKKNNIKPPGFYRGKKIRIRDPKWDEYVDRDETLLYEGGNQ